jgi:signal transduction histidine kinase
VAVLAGRTWLAILHQLVGFVIAAAEFTVVVIGLAVGFSLLVVWVGLPVLLATLWCCQVFARAERARFRFFLGTSFSDGPRAGRGTTNWWRHSWRLLTGAQSWEFVLYVVVRLPLSMAQVVVVPAVWGLALALAALPAYNSALPRGGAAIGEWVLHGPLVAAGCVAGLVLLVFGAPPVTMALAAVDSSVARWLLGPRRADLTERIGELERSRAQVVDSAEAERRRIERDLHDGAQQRLVALALELGRAKARFETDPQAAQAIVGQAHEQAKAALSELRSLVRGMHPPVLSDRGLDAALSGLAAISPVPVTLDADLKDRPSPQIEAIAYFVVAEALTNVAKHARASQVTVRVAREDDMLAVTVADDGIGGADPHGQGLSGLASRVAAVDGRLVISSPPGGPTSIEVTLPCGS